MTDPVSILCPECASSPGDACRDRAARAKPTCAARRNAAVLAGANTPATVPVPAGTPADEPLLVACPKCRAAVGMKCRDYRGKGKATCKERSAAPVAPLPPPAPAPAPGLDFGGQTGPEGEQSADPTPAARTASVRSAAGSSAPTAAANAPATAGTDFDDSTPPPRTRPRGLPLPRVVTLPPGEDVIGIFHDWEREGRVPAGSILCDFAPLSAWAPFGADRKRPAYQVIASGTGAEREPDLDGYRIVAEVRRQPSPAAKWVVMVPNTRAAA